MRQGAARAHLAAKFSTPIRNFMQEDKEKKNERKYAILGSTTKK